MKTFTARILGTLLGFTMAVVIIANPIFAISPPTSISINAVYAYQHLLENNDQLYLIDFTIDYTVSPNETIQQAYIFRLMSGATELSATAPYYFPIEPWGRKLAAIYFSAADAPTWSDNYTAELRGNPTLSWVGGEAAIPLRTDDIDYWSASSGIEITKTELSLRVLALAQEFETAWSVDMIENVGGGQAITTTYGETYFNNAIPHCKDIAPYAYSSRMLTPDFEHRTADMSYSENLSANVTTGTPMDLTALGALLGLDKTMMSVIMAGIIIFVFAMAWTTTTRSTKPIMLLLSPVVTGCVLAVGLPLILAILLGLGSMIFAIYVITYEKAMI